MMKQLVEEMYMWEVFEMWDQSEEDKYKCCYPDYCFQKFHLHLFTECSIDWAEWSAKQREWESKKPDKTLKDRLYELDEEWADPGRDLVTLSELYQGVIVITDPDKER